MERTPHKQDEGKLRYDLLPAVAMEQVVAVLTHGAGKYGDKNYLGLEEGRIHAALLRHHYSAVKGEVADKYTGKSHWAHVACNAIMLLEMEMNGAAK